MRPTPRFPNRRQVIAAVAGTTVLAGCADLGEDRTKARVRLVNAADATGYPALDMRVETGVLQGNVAYGQNGAYSEVAPDDTQNSTITNAGSPSALVTFSPTLTRDKHYSVLAYGGTGALRHLVIEETVAEPAVNHTSLRIFNAAPDAGNLDVYITADSDALTTAVPALAAAKYGELSAVLDLASGTWRVRVAAAGSKVDLRLNVPAVAFGNRQALTLVLTPSSGGTLVNALLLVQSGALTRLDNVHARVRVAPGVTNNGAVTVVQGTAALATNLSWPAVGAYALVPAGAAAFNISVDGNSVGAPAGTLAAGGDYTLLVYGLAASAQAALIADNNRLPTTAGEGLVRLVNGVAGLASPLSMSFDSVSVASSVAAGAASTPYVGITDTTTGVITVTSPGAGSVFTATARTVRTGRVYTVFVIGAAGAVEGALVQDR